MATDATKKELFAQKDRIKTEWKSSLYKELDGNLKIDVMNLGKKIIENKNSRAYQLLTEFCTRTGRNMQATENNINTGKTEKMDTFLLTAILQAGAIASCDNEAVLRNAKIAMITSGVEFRTSNAVDGDPRGNTMAALMGMFEDMKKAGVVTDADFD